MNILVLSWRGPKHPLAGGAEQVMHEHMKAWVEAGHKVVFFTSHPKGSRSQEEIDGIRIIRRGSQYLLVHFYAFLWYVFGKHSKFDVVVDEFHGWPFFTPLYSRAPKLAVIQELTKEVWFRYPLPFGLKYIFGPLGYLLEPLFFLPYRKVKFMTGSESAKRELSSVGILQKNIVVVPHGVIINAAKKMPAKEKTQTVIYLGALASDKGIEDAIKTFALINRSGNFKFWIVGKGDDAYLSKLKTLVKKLKLENKVTFWGFVSQKKKYELLARAHLMVNPSIREGWGLVNIEANAMGVPVVAYNSKGLIDSVRDGVTGIICKQNTPQHLAKEVTNLLKDAPKYKGLSDNAVKWSKEFTWKKSAKKSLDLIESLQK